MDCGTKLANNEEHEGTDGAGEYVRNTGKHDYVS